MEKNPRSMTCFRYIFDSVILITVAVFFFTQSSSVVAEDDVRCLRGVRDSLRDPRSSLASWNFNNNTAGFICSFQSVRCWNEQENRAIALEPNSYGLAGTIPSDLQFRKSLQNLNFAGNNFTGSIPRELCTWMEFLVSIDLSDNQLTGKIPTDLGNCKYLNSINLSGNQLSGNIPPQLSKLVRLSQFSVKNNALFGPIPSGLSNFDSASFDGNSGLCGMPLGKCGGLSTKSLNIIIVAGVFGAAMSLLIGFGLWWCKS